MFSLAEHTLEKILSDIGEADCEFLSLQELDRFPAICCGMANGDGGWIVMGATREDGQFCVEGAEDVAFLEQRLRMVLRNFREISVDPALSFRVLASDGKKLLLVKVAPADWRKRPVCAGESSYRRVEGVDVVSGRATRVRMALDALEALRDDHPVRGLSVGDLNPGDIASFRDAVVRRRPEWAGLSEVEFLKRALVLDEYGTPTRAGQLLLGNVNPVRAVFGKASTDVFDARNLWAACTELLPRLGESVSRSCAGAVRECFLNALIHADHDAGRVLVERDGATVSLSNPGLPRTEVPGESLSRNYRLMRMFVLAGFASGDGKGLEIVRAFDAAFRLRWDVLELRTLTELPLEIAAVDDETAPPLLETKPLPSEAAVGWLPVMSKEQDRDPEGALPENPLLPGLVGLPFSELGASFSGSGEEGVPLSVWVEEIEASVPNAEETPEPATSVPEESPVAIKDVLPEEPTPEPAFSGEPVVEEATPEEPVPEEKTAPAKVSVFGDAAHELEEYVVSLKNGSGEDARDVPVEAVAEPVEEKNEQPAISPNVQMVRDTPRPSASAVRGAILELCGEYRSIRELASLLARSEGSLRRHYLTAMVREGLLELEFPENVGRPDQRYRVPPRGRKK